MCVLMNSRFIENPSDDPILHMSFYYGGITSGIRAISKKCMLTNLKNDQQHFYGEERVLPT
jgi:hypothetical protein